MKQLRAMMPSIMVGGLMGVTALTSLASVLFVIGEMWVPAVLAFLVSIDTAILAITTANDTGDKK